MTARATTIMEHVEDIFRQMKLTEMLESEQTDGKFSTLLLGPIAISSCPSKFWNLVKLTRACTWRL
jgi:hypothetical protein